MKEHKVDIGSSDIVIIDKAFGPTIFASLKIEADLEKGWVIKREWIKTGEWIEWCAIPAQINQEFSDYEE